MSVTTPGLGLRVQQFGVLTVSYPIPSIESCIFFGLYYTTDTHNMASGILKVKGTQVVDQNDKPIILRGAAIGGWLKYAWNPVRVLD